MTEEERKEQFFNEMYNFVKTINKGDYYQEGFASADQVERELERLIEEYELFES